MYKTLTTERHRYLVKALIEARTQAGLTQTELAQQLGEYQSFVARLESGQRRVDVVEFIKLSEILHFEPNIILQKLKSLPE